MLLKIFYYPHANSKNRKGKGIFLMSHSDFMVALDQKNRSFVQVYVRLIIAYCICRFSWSQSKITSQASADLILLSSASREKDILNSPRPKQSRRCVLINLKDLLEKNKSRSKKPRMGKLASQHKTLALIQHFP